MNSEALVLNWVWLILSVVGLAGLGFALRRTVLGGLLILPAGFLFTGIGIKAGRPIFIDAFLERVYTWLPHGSAEFTHLTAFALMCTVVLVVAGMVVGVGVLVGAATAPTASELDFSQGANDEEAIPD